CRISIRSMSARGQPRRLSDPAMSASPPTSDIRLHRREPTLWATRRLASADIRVIRRTPRVWYTTYLLPKPGNRQVNASYHCKDRSHPSPSSPNPARAAGREYCSHKADHQRAECGRRGPAVPKHLRREKIQNGIGNIAGAVHTQKDNAL